MADVEAREVAQVLEAPQGVGIPAASGTARTGEGGGTEGRDRGGPGPRRGRPAPPSIGALRRNDRLLLGGVLAYSGLVVLLMFLRGVEITPDVMVVAFALAAVVLGGGRLFLRDWLPFVALLLAYELMRGLADDVGFPVHVADMVAAERLVALGTLPTALLQGALHPATGPDHLAELATVVYMLHFALPLVTGFVLWVARRPQYHDFMAALIILSLSAFATYLLMPAAPPWWAARSGVLGDGATISYLKPGAFETLANGLGFAGHYIYTYMFYGINPNLFAAWPSLHVAYPFLTFLFLRRAFGRVGWLAFAYTVVVAASVIYTGDHWIIDCIGGVAYAYVAYFLVVHTSIVQRWVARVRAAVRVPAVRR